MRVYKFVCTKYGLENLQRRRLKIATLDRLNDPFELLAAHLSDLTQRKKFKRAKEKAVTSVGMLCFSGRWRNPVQWSHYADEHRRLCLGFDVPVKELHGVSYKPKRIDLDLARLSNDVSPTDKYWLQILTTKFSHWRYENEKRCFVRLEDRKLDGGRYFEPFSERLVLREIIMGPDAKISQDELYEALGDIAPNVSILKARLAFRSFRVVRQRKRSLWWC